MPTFDNWKFEDAEMLVLLQQMFVDLEFTSKFTIKVIFTKISNTVTP